MGVTRSASAQDVIIKKASEYKIHLYPAWLPRSEGQAGDIFDCTRRPERFAASTSARRN